MIPFFANMALGGVLKKIPWQAWVILGILVMLWFGHRQIVSSAVANAINANNTEVALQYVEKIQQLEKDKAELRLSLEEISHESEEVTTEIIETIREVRVEVEVPSECNDLGTDFLQQYSAQIRAAAGS